MSTIVSLIQAIFSWPSIVFWLCLIFREDLSGLLKRVQSIRIPSVEGTFKTTRSKR